MVSIEERTEGEWLGTWGRVAFGCLRTLQRGARRCDPRLELCRLLWDQSRECGRSGLSSDGAENGATCVSHTLWGRPYLEESGRRERAALSFSYGRDSCWGAMGPAHCGLGIDLAERVDFPGDFPSNRVFPGDEVRAVREFYALEERDCRAFLWSAKEAVVKALGCGFHLADPRDVWVHPGGRTKSSLEPAVMLSGSLERCLEVSGIHLYVRSVQMDRGWLSIAFSNERARLLPVGFPGQNTGVSAHLLFQNCPVAEGNESLNY